MRSALLTSIASAAAVLVLGARPVAAGSIASVGGEIAGGQPIKVTGTGFGATGPEVVVFDDFDGCPACQSGNPIALDGPDVGQWTNSTNFPTYTSDQSHAGLSMVTSNYLPNTGGCPGPNGQGCDETSNYSRVTYGFSPPASEVFWSFWRYLPQDQTLPLESCNNVNWKVSWLYGTNATPDNVINDWFLPAYVGHGDGFEEPTIGSNQGFGETNCGKDMYPLWMIEPTAAGHWIRYSMHVKGSSSCEGALRLWEVPFAASPIGGVPCGDPSHSCEMLRKERTDIDTMVEPWHFLTLNAYARGNEGVCNPTDVSAPRYDDAYVAVGPGAQARVEIASHETWGDPAFADSLDMSICPPTAWSDTSVTCTFRPGSFADGQDAYLFIVDANGVVSDQDPAKDGAQGFPIKLGRKMSSGSGGGSATTGSASAASGTGTGDPSAASGAGGATSSANGDTPDEASDSGCGCSAPAPRPSRACWFAVLVGATLAFNLRGRAARTRAARRRKPT